jgi:hypothetical protein
MKLRYEEIGNCVIRRIFSQSFTAAENCTTFHPRRLFFSLHFYPGVFMNRRHFIRTVGGGSVLAVAAASQSGCSLLSSGFPADALQVWQGPVASESDPRKRALAYAITAPNPHNLQPWLVDLREANTITVFTDRERVLPETDPFGRQILIGHGAFLELLVIALAQQGLAAQVTLWPEGELPASLKDWDSRPIARISLAPAAAGNRPDALFKQILMRHTPKTDFDITRSVSPGALQTLVNSVGSSDGVRAAGLVEAARLQPLRDLCLQSAKVELLTHRTMMESLKLIRLGPDEILQHRDGISINSPFLRVMGSVGMFDRSAPPAEGSAGYKSAMDRFEGHSRTAMGFVWLSTPGNSRSQQIEAGRSYLRLQLAATDIGLGVHPMSQALQEFAEMKPFYDKAHQLMLGKPAPQTPNEETLQMFCRLGYAPGEVAATPRRAIEKFMLTS